MNAEQITELGTEAGRELDEHGRVRIEYQPGNGTRYDVLIVQSGPTARIIGLANRQDDDALHEQGDVAIDWDGRKWYVAVLNAGVACEMNRGAPLPSYLREKLTKDNHADACALHLLLAAVADVQARVTLSSAGVWDATD